MGVGFCVVASKTSIDDIISAFEKHKMRCEAVGKIEKGKGEVTARLDGRKETL
jgi:phosphoribosylaminoimidazole (AIR) synthetase